MQAEPAMKMDFCLGVTFLIALDFMDTTNGVNSHIRIERFLEILWSRVK